MHKETDGVSLTFKHLALAKCSPIQRKRARKKYNAASGAEHSESSGEKLEQLTVPDNISPVETDEEIPGGGKHQLLKNILSAQRKNAGFFF